MLTIRSLFEGIAEDAVVMALDQFNGLMETVHLLKSPANAGTPI